VKITVDCPYKVIYEVSIGIMKIFNENSIPDDT